MSRKNCYGSESSCTDSYTIIWLHPPDHSWNCFLFDLAVKKQKQNKPMAYFTHRHWFPRIFPKVGEGFQGAGRGKRTIKRYCVWASLCVQIMLTSPGNVGPCAAYGPEVNAQYLNPAYLALSPHPVGPACQHMMETHLQTDSWPSEQLFPENPSKSSPSLQYYHDISIHFSYIVKVCNTKCGTHT